MKLIKFAIDNYRGVNGGLDNNVIDFESSNAIFIFGQNNVGKSSFLRAYDAFYEDKVSGDDFTYGTDKDITVEITLKIDEEKDKSIIDQGTGGKYENLKSKYLDSRSLLKLRKTWLFSDKGKVAKNETYNIAESKWEAVGYGGIGLHTAFQPLMMKPLFIEAMPTEEQVELIVNEVLKDAATKKLSDKESKEYKEALEKITELQDKAYSKASIETYRKKVNEHFQALFSSYEVDIDDGTSKAKYTHDKLGKDFKIGFKKSADSQPSSYKQMGHGAVRMAIFLLMLMRDELREEGMVEKNFLVLFEEPELFLHPILTKKLRNLIYDVSAEDMPFQILCASHSPQMIDISKDHTSLVRMIKNDSGDTHLYQVKKEDLKTDTEKTDNEIKQKIHEIQRFDPFLCESFYADEVVLVEGDTEAIIWRGYEQLIGYGNKDLFVVNCHSCMNIPFYQKIFSKFNIQYSVISDTDHLLSGDASTVNRTGWNKDSENPVFTSGIQKSIYDQYIIDKANSLSKNYLVISQTFEPCHEILEEPFTYDPSGSEGKPFKANRYWEKIAVSPEAEGFKNVPIISHIKKILLS
jgi:predicted ATP-dependent endonuclease of OLD family